MSLVYLLGPTSATAITLIPTADAFSDDRQLLRSITRGRTGKLFIREWGAYDAIRASLEFVSPSDASLVNSWWESGTKLLFITNSGGASKVNSVMLMNTTRPFPSFQNGAAEEYKGTIVLEGY